jgi:hypothetical protein
MAGAYEIENMGSSSAYDIPVEPPPEEVESAKEHGLEV